MTLDWLLGVFGAVTIFVDSPIGEKFKQVLPSWEAERGGGVEEGLSAPSKRSLVCWYSSRAFSRSSSGRVGFSANRSGVVATSPFDGTAFWERE